MPTAQAKLVDVEYFPLANPADMITVLTFALTVGWRGSISAWPDPDPDGDHTPTWALTVDPVEQGTAHPIVASLGDDTVVWDGATLKHLTAAQFTANYVARGSDG